MVGPVTERDIGLMRAVSSCLRVRLCADLGARKTRMTPTPSTPTAAQEPALQFLSADTRAALALAAATLLWSGNFIVGRALRADIDPATLNLLRWALSLLIFVPWVGAKSWRHPYVIAREWRLLIALGATGIAAFHTLVYLALMTTTALNALLMLSLAPAAILGGSVLTGGTRLSRAQWAGALLSLVGACILVTRGDPAVLSSLSSARGDLWMLAAVTLWAVYSLLLRRRPADLPSDVALAASIVPALGLLLLAVALIPGTNSPTLTPRMLMALLYLAVFASLAGFLLWSYGVERIGPERAGQFLHLMPVFGAALAGVLLDEAIVPAQMIGALCVFAGIALVKSRCADARPFGASKRRPWRAWRPWI